VTPHSITFDFETKSYADLKKVGSWAYSEDPTTDVICACWGIDSQPIQEWTPEDGSTRATSELFALIRAGVPVEAHNVAFELGIWHNVMGPRYGWPIPAGDQWLDTAAVARYYALPAGLDKLAAALGFEGKDPDGNRLITKYSKLHLKTAQPVIPPEDLRRFVDYCRKDVQIEQSVSDKLGDLPEREIENFHFDRRMNLRGIYLDEAGIDAAAKIVDQRSEDLTRKFVAITGLNPTQNVKLLDWFEDNGLALENLKAEVLEELMENGSLPQGKARDAIQIKLQVSKASTKKLDAMTRARAKDGRARFQTTYHGAQTGRNTGAGFQPLNLRHSIEAEKCKALDGSAAVFPTPEDLVGDIMRGDAAWLDCIYGDAMEAIAQASRHWIKAAPGNHIIAGDFVSIEAVLLACMSGEEWKIEAFRKRVDLYCLMAEKIYNLPTGTVTKKTHPTQRQDGKRGELAFGYQGALGAWLKFDPYPIHTDERIIEICKLWRKEHPHVTSYWYDMEAAAIEAVEHPGRTTSCRMIGFQIEDEWLSMILPNGKRIWYFKPELRAGMPKWHKPQQPTLENGEPNPCNLGICKCQPKAYVSYMAQKEGQWRRVSTYGGKLVENATQATSRELLMPAARRAEKHGYTPVLTVYDEIVTEVPLSFGSAKELEEIMIDDLPSWAAGWPINAEAWAGERYRK
jgi:DNA polymerase